MRRLALVPLLLAASPAAAHDPHGAVDRECLISSRPVWSYICPDPELRRLAAIELDLEELGVFDRPGLSRGRFEAERDACVLAPDPAHCLRVLYRARIGAPPPEPLPGQP